MSGLSFQGGCSGNLAGSSSLVRGAKIGEGSGAHGGGRAMRAPTNVLQPAKHTLESKERSWPKVRLTSLFWFFARGMLILFA